MGSPATPPLPDLEAPNRVPPTASVPALVRDIVLYPLRGQGIYMLLGYMLCHLVMQLFRFIPLAGYFSFGLGAIVFAFGAYVTVFIRDVIMDSADGRPEPPDWPDFSNFRDDILQPALLIFVTTMICFGPIIGYNFYRPEAVNVTSGLPRYPLWVWAYPVAALFYFPMGLLAVILHQSLLALNPYLVVKSIVKTFGPYVICWLTILAVIAVTALIMMVPYVRYLARYILSLYAVLVIARALGLFYYRYQKRLDWF